MPERSGGSNGDTDSGEPPASPDTAGKSRMWAQSENDTSVCRPVIRFAETGRLRIRGEDEFR